VIQNIIVAIALVVAPFDTGGDANSDADSDGEITYHMKVLKGIVSQK
jgi:hypothetical protein